MAKQDYIIATDACSDIIPFYADEEDVRVVPMEVTMTDGTKFDATYDMDLDWFYDRIRNGAFAQTSAITPQRYFDFFTPLLEAGHDILYNCFTSGMSSTYSNACMAAEIFRERYPERKFCVVDSLSATGGQGYHTYFAARNRDKGMPIEENAKWLEETRRHVQCTWTVDDLMHLNRGGRLSKTAAIFGTALQIKPVGDIDDEGCLVSIGKVRGRKQALHHLCNVLVNTLDDPEKNPVLICHCSCPNDAEALKQMVLETGKVSEVIIGRTGPVVGTHLGPSGLTMFYFCNKRIASL
ncbi:MAG: DegV family protein [Eubacterium sp.]|nr:DegV family protein [Eubacterium sp.]